MRIAALLLLIHLTGYAEAARIITITIDVDGKPFLEGGSGDNGSPPPAAVWRYLTSSLLSPAQGVAVAPDPADPLKATLVGKIHIEVRYGGKADVEELQLVRAGTNVGWTVAEDDVERIAKDIGLGIMPVVTPP